ncbi:MAG: response regulator [Chloroflexota bacterium]
MVQYRTLIVDDSPDFLKIARRFVERCEGLVFVGAAGVGEQAIRLAGELQPDLVLLDLILPDINGVEVARAIHAGLPQALIVIMTLYDLDEYREQALAAGAHALISKAELTDAWINSLVRKMTVKSEPCNILVVDDSPTMRRMVMAALRPLGANFGEATSGLEAVEQLAVNEYQAVTLDLNMPDMHGLEVLQVLRASERYRRLPVVVLTTRGDDDTREAALTGGANLYLTKPFQPNELLQAVKGLLAV